MDPESVYAASPEETFESRPIGEYLRRQRILRGMSAEELSDLTRIPLRSLERLESGQFDGETDGFVRGFVRTVAAALGLDTDDAISRMLQEAEPNAWEQKGRGRSLGRGVAIAALVLGLIGLLLGVRSIWGALVGDGAASNAREVVIWRDPVRALAEASGEADALEPGAALSVEAARPAEATEAPPIATQAARPARPAPR